MSKRRDDDRNRPNFLVAANRDNSAISCSTTTVSGGIVSASTTSCPSTSNKQREEMVVPLYGSFDAQIEQHDDIWTSALAAPPVGHHHVDEQDNDLRYISNMMTKNGPPHEYSHHDHDTNGPEPESYEQQQHQPLDHLAINTGATSMEGYTMLQQQHRQKTTHVDASTTAPTATFSTTLLVILLSSSFGTTKCYNQSESIVRTSIAELSASLVAWELQLSSPPC